MDPLTNGHPDSSDESATNSAASSDVDAGSAQLQRYNTLQYPIFLARARARRLRQHSAFLPTLHPPYEYIYYSTTPPRGVEPGPHMFEVKGRIVDWDCYLTTSGDIKWINEDPERAVASCWVQALEGGEMAFLERLCEVREAADQAVADNFVTSELLLTAPGHHSVLLQVGWSLHDGNGNSRAAALPVFNSDLRPCPPATLSAVPFRRPVRVGFTLCHTAVPPGERALVGARLEYMIIL